MSSWDYFVVTHMHDLNPVLDACENIAQEACRRIKARKLDLPPVTKRNMIDKSSGKVRLIGKESAMQQVFDYIARYSCEEIWSKRMKPQQVSSIKSKGQVVGVKMLKKWVSTENKCRDYHSRHHLNTYHRRTKYYAILDITKCFPSMRLETFLKFFIKDCANQDIIWLWTELLNSHRDEEYQGFMIGSLISESAAQYLLSFLYDYSLSLHAKGRRGQKPVKKMHKALYFMDDQFYCSSNRAHLKSAIKDIIKYAQNELGITIKPNWQIYDIDLKPIDIMGYLIHSDGSITLRKRIFIRARRMALRYQRTRKMNYSQAKRICAYKGYFYPNYKKHKQSIHIQTNSRMIKNKYHLRKLFKDAQIKTSKEAKKRQKIKNIIV